MALRKSELYSLLWQSCDALRGGIPEADVTAPDSLVSRYWAVCPRLERELFSDEGIRRAIAECAALFPT